MIDYDLSSFILSVSSILIAILSLKYRFISINRPLFILIWSIAISSLISQLGFREVANYLFTLAIFISFVIVLSRTRKRSIKKL